MTAPSLAICVPAYNEAAVLPRLLASIRSQTVQPDEVWIHDDASTDETASTARSFGAKVVQSSGNRGCSAGKNALAERTHCDWLHFIDADDAMLPAFVANCRKWMADVNRPDVVLFSYEYRDNRTNELLHVTSFDPMLLQKDPVRYTICEQINNVGLYRREPFLAARGFDLDSRVLYNEDVALHIRLALAGLKFTAEEAVSLCRYRRVQSMSAANQLKCIQAQYHVLAKAADRVGRSHGIDIADRLWRLAGCAAAWRDLETADACTQLAVKLNGRTPPKSSRVFATLCSFSPPLAIRVRERLIRILKPKLRRGM